ncbi:MAG: helix-turn-helix transcriptional regulator [Actinomycetota bacterium]
MTNASKAERLLNLIVMLLETSRPISLQEIHQTIPGYGQDQWDAFKRMFERDKQELHEMGIPVERAPMDVWELEEGYRIPKDRYYLPELELAPDELAALWLAAGLVRMRDDATARSAMLKLGHNKPVEQSTNPHWLSADLSLTAPSLPIAFEAVTEKKTLTFAYRSRSGEAVRILDPYGLVHRKGVWYLVGMDHGSTEVRSFRLDRVQGVIRQTDPTKSGADFEAPENFRAEAALETPPFVQGIRIMQAEVVFAPSVAWWAERSSPWLNLQSQSGGGAIAFVEVTDVDGFIGWVLSFGDGAEVTAPPELREVMHERLAEMCEPKK